MEAQIYTDCSTRSDYDLQWSALLVMPDETEHRQNQVTTIHEVKQEFSKFKDKDFPTHPHINEMVGLRNAIRLASKISGFSKLKIYTDSQSNFDIINGIGEVKNKKSHPNRANFYRCISSDVKKMIELSPIPIEVMWVPGHDSNWGNNIADKLTRKGSEKFNEIEKLHG